MTDSRPVLLLEHEAAERLRCSTTTVKRLRLTGQLAYLPGRPVKIEESALIEYIARQRVPAAREASTTQSFAPRITTAEKVEQDDVLQARRYWLRRQLR